MNRIDITATRSSESVLSTNKLIKNTYILLSMTLLFSAVTATASVLLAVPGWTYMASLIGAMVLIWFVLPRTANSSAGLGVIFGITGLMGFGLGPILNHYLSMANGSQIVGTAMAGTGIIFLGLSGYALTSKRDFNFMGGFLMAGLLVVFIAILAGLFIDLPALHLAISAVVIMLMSGFILYDTSRMVHGGETNYIMATIGLYLNIYNLFVHLLALLGALSGDD
ncbi:MAG: Bax inhibitor-1/YccA family protein [Candidatus Thiodiazotropha sp.]|nr:Bax inhibitor-1/YccA family protein [Candidatus Thiodiazotropha sp.]MCM8885127.1 Bax inhibitor-1/YccA family protein [Candidatus Thiodiazotropha sp.]MCM8921235.1 Bax inhibitor-1/YccA family protein [Candidatus Thiodiazotropha sp.]MCU7871337.1 Bax inhibitor-1/YccA family protein [Candidatus Thiodiazotropha sp. (ex Lucinoma borealis)]MCU7946239.1 Bax inhibitor-1/YccA family protein [Candidatus Thiodiazotropha sp. (ex Cardiolucina cf. quadrata)]